MPMLILGTKMPSITSTWSQSAPPASKASRLRCFHIRIRAKIDHYVTGKTIQKIREMDVGKELFFDLAEENCYGALIQRLETGYRVAIRTITAHMANYVAELAIKMPHFFGEALGTGSAALPDVYRSKEELTRARLRYNRAVRYQNAMSAYFAVTAGKLSRDSMMELTGCIHPILDCAVKFLRPNGINLSVKQTTLSAVASGSPSALRFAVASMLSIAAENTADGRLRAETRYADEDFAIHLTFEPAIEESVLKKLLECYYGGELLDSAYRDVCFDLLLLQMLSETMGWKFGVTRAGCANDLLALTLYIPLSEEKTPALSLPFDPMPLLEVSFANLLLREEK